MRLRLLFASLAIAALAGEKVAKSKGPAAPAGGVKTPGVQVPFTLLPPLATVPLNAPINWIASADRALYASAGAVIVRIDPATNKPGEPITGLNQPCGGLVSAFGALWSPQCGNGTLARIDPKTSKITASIESGIASVPGAITATSDSIWLLTDSKTTLARIDPDRNAVAGEVRLPAGCQSLVAHEKSIWTACPARNQILRVSETTNIIEEVIKLEGQPSALAAGAAGVLWALGRKTGSVTRIDTKTNQSTKTIELGAAEAGGSLVFADDVLWVTQKNFPLARIDTKTATVMQQFFSTGSAGGGGMGLALSPGAIWLASADTVLRIDPKRVLAALPVE